MDDLLFGAAADQVTLDRVLAVLEFLRDRRANRPGMVLFGLHTFGILGAGLVRGGPACGLRPLRLGHGDDAADQQPAQVRGLL
jgi:hypothetical protein